MIEQLPTADLTIENVEQQFAKWRASRSKKMEPIPLHLWQAAVALCKTHRVTHVCRRLRLCFPDLKKRLPPKAQPTFIELTGGSFLGQWQLTCQRPDGTRLQLCAAGPSPAIEPLIRQFLA